MVSIVTARHTDQAFATDLARGAGHILTQCRDQIGSGEYDAKALRDRGDQEAQRYLSDRLTSERPDDAVLSEEAADSTARLGAERVWIIDPLDGTREYSERTDGLWRSDWAVHVALWTRDDGLVAGAVAMPALDEVFEATEYAMQGDADAGAAHDSAGELPRPLKLAASRSHPPDLVDRIVKNYDVELVRMGSAGVKTMSVLKGETDAYIHDGGQYEWDSAAPVAVAPAHGLHASRPAGSAFQYNQANPWLPDLVICHRRHAER